MSTDRISYWIFLRGLGRETAHWDEFPRQFAEAFPNARMHLIDLPGNGENWQLRSPTTIAETLGFVREQAVAGLLNDRQPGQPVYLLALSLGAMVSLEWLRRYPRELQGAVLINTSLRGFSPLQRRLSWRCWPLLLRILSCREPTARERLILRLTTNFHGATPEFIAKRVAAARRHPVRACNVARQLLSAARYRPALVKPAVPILLLSSRGDHMVDPGCSADIAGHWQAALVTHPSAGHDLPLDDPTWVITQVREWLSGIPDSGLRPQGTSLG